jgi:hypothetical protein
MKPSSKYLIAICILKTLYEYGLKIQRLEKVVCQAAAWLRLCDNSSADRGLDAALPTIFPKTMHSKSELPARRLPPCTPPGQERRVKVSFCYKARSSSQNQGAECPIAIQIGRRCLIFPLEYVAWISTPGKDARETHCRPTTAKPPFGSHPSNLKTRSTLSLS